MSRKVWTFGLVALAAVILACGTVSRLVDQTPAPPGPEGQESQGAAESGQTDFSLPLQPDPWQVTVAVDPTRTAKSIAMAGVALGGFVQLQGTDGAHSELQLPSTLLASDSSGGLVPALGQAVSLTAIQAVEGLPFEGTFLAGVQIAPAGDLFAEPARLTLTLPGLYTADQLFGFASDDSGGDFHLVPVQVIAMPGTGAPPGLPTMPPLPPELATMMPPAIDYSVDTTSVYFEIMHFSDYGVVLTSIDKIAMRKPHPPSSALDQVDDLLAPLPPNPYDILRIEYRDVIKPLLDPIDNLEQGADCGKAARVAQRYLAWKAAVRNKGLEKRFSKEIARSEAILRSALKDCLKIQCDVCFGAAGGGHEQMVVLTVLAEGVGLDMSSVPWALLTNECAQRSGFPRPFPEMGSCGRDCPNVPQATPVLACPK